VQRLKTRAQFLAVMAGSTVSRTAHFALHRAALDAKAPAGAGPASKKPASASPASALAAPEERLPPTVAQSGPESPALFPVTAPWIGALIPKRWAKRAVTRNAIKRQIYTVSQHFEPQLPAAAHVVRLRAGFDRTQFVSASSEALKRAVRGELQELFARAAP
jgi:ribonuclease P protein component